MEQYKITLRITEGNKRTWKRGERETIRYRILKAISGGFPGVSLGRFAERKDSQGGVVRS